MFAIGSSAVVRRPGHRMPGDERRRHSGRQHRVTQFSLVLPFGTLRASRTRQPLTTSSPRTARIRKRAPGLRRSLRNGGAGEPRHAGRCGVRQSSKMATARVQPAEAPRILCGKQLTVKPCGGRASRLCSFSRWQ